MKKTITCAFMLFMAVTAWAECKITNESGSKYVAGELISYQLYTITVDKQGDLAAAFGSGSSVDVSSLKTATHFKFTGELNSDDLWTIKAENFGGTGQTGDVYFDFSEAELGSGTDFTALTHSTVKYIILPDGATEIDVHDFPSNVQEMLAANSKDKLLLLYASSASDGRMSHLCSYTGSWNQTDMAGVSMKLYGTFKDVFGQMFVNNNGAAPKCSPVSIDLTGASFPTFTAEDKFVKSSPTLALVEGDTYKAGGSISAWMGSSTGDVTGKANGLAELNQFKESVTKILLPTDDKTTLLPMQSCSGMSKLEGELVIPANIKTIGACAMEGVGSSVVTIKSAKEIGRAAMANAKNIKNVSLPQGLKTVEPYLFSGCTELDNVELPEGVTRIEEYAFGTSGNEAGLQLHAIRLPNTLEYIGENAFRLNMHLKTLTIPAGVKKIESNAFSLCTAITDVYFLGKETIPEVAYNAFDGETYYGNNSNGNRGSNNEVAQATTFTKGEGGNAKVMAILHYPIVSVAAEYKAMDNDAISAYNAAVAAANLPEEIYTKTGDDSYVMYNGIPETGETYYTKSFTAGTTTTTTVKAVEDVTEYYSDADGTGKVTPLLKTNTYYTASEEPNYVQTYAPQEFTDPTTNFYTQSDGVYTETTIKFLAYDWKKIYYKDVDGNIEQVTSETVFVPGTDYYTDDKGETKVTDWNYVLNYTTPLYYVNGTKTVYTAATEYVYGTTYYTKVNDWNDEYTKAETLEFSSAYYYYPQTAEYNAADNTTIGHITALRSYNPYIAATDDEGNTTYTKVDGAIDTDEGKTCVTLVNEACDNLYGQYYTDLERNAKYTGIPSSYDETTQTYTSLNVDYNWPIGAEEYKYDGSGTGNYAGDKYAGLKNFQLVAGWKEGQGREGEYTPSTPAPRLDRNIWYTFCVPANLSKNVIREAFGGNTQVCRFLGMRKKDDGSNSFVIDFSVDMMTETITEELNNTVVPKYGDEEIIIESCVPYMIHPSTQPALDEGGFVSPIQYFITGSTGYDYTFGMEAKSYYGDYDPSYGKNQANTDACKNYLSGYKFVGNIDKHNRTEFCYYFGNVWKDGDTDHKQYPELQAFWSYEGKEKEGWELELSLCSGYIIYDGGVSAAGAKPAMVEMNFGVSYDDMEPTGIQEINDRGAGAETGGTDRDTQVYNLSGQPVGKDLRGLPKGVYIKGGKKYIVK